jgi:O-antigen/teichoic acid export membrane protein
MREMKFGLLSIIEIIITALGVIVTLGLALGGYGALSVAWAGLLQSAIASALVVYFRPDYWVFAPCLKDWRAIIHFGGFTSVGFVLSRSYELFISTICSTMLSLAALGKFNRATMICDLPLKGLLSGVVPIALPALALEQRNGRCMKESFFNAISFITAILWPALIFVMLFAQPIVHVMLGSNWESVIPLVPIIAAAGLTSFPSFLTYPILVVAGDVTKTVVAQTISFPLCALIMMAAASTSLEAFAWSLILTTFIQNGVSLIYIRKSVGFEWHELFSSLKSSAALTLASSIVPICVIAFAARHGEVTILDAVIGGIGAGLGFVTGLLHMQHPLSPHAREALNALIKILKSGRQVA